MSRQLKHRPGDPAFKRKEATGCNHRICLAQALREKSDQRFVDLGMSFCKRLEVSPAEEAHLGIAHRHYCRRTRLPVDDRKLSDDGAQAEKGKDALSTGARNNRDLEQTVLDAIAAVIGSARPEQDLTRGEPHQLCVSKQLRRKRRRQSRQQTGVFRSKTHMASSGSKLMSPRR